MCFTLWNPDDCLYEVFDLMGNTICWFPTIKQALEFVARVNQGEDPCEIL